MNWWEDVSSERMRQPEQIVTGEGVLLAVSPATVAVRVVSGVIDYSLYALGLVITIVSWAVWWVGEQPLSQAALAAQLSVLMVVWMVGVPLAIETLSRGRSLGRLVTGTRVVRDDGASVRARHCLVRTLVAVIEVWGTLGVLALGSCVLTRRSKRLGDLLAGTYVISERAGATTAPPLLMPPELAQWAWQADIRPLPGPEALAARTFLQRASTMNPASRQAMGKQIAASLATRVSPAPPAGTHPERMIAAVLCERRDRELAMAQADRQAEARALQAAGHRPYEL